MCGVCRVFSVDVGGGSVMLPLCTLYPVLYTVYHCISLYSDLFIKLACRRRYTKSYVIGKGGITM